jgi:hypothetical protein
MIMKVNRMTAINICILESLPTYIVCSRTAEFLSALFVDKSLLNSTLKE